MRSFLKSELIIQALGAEAAKLEIGDSGRAIIKRESLATSLPITFIRDYNNIVDSPQSRFHDRSVVKF